MFSAFFVLKVSKELMKLGWSPQTLPSSFDTSFRGAILELKQQGADAERAALLISEAMRNNEGIASQFMHIGPNWRAMFGPGSARDW